MKKIPLTLTNNRKKIAKNRFIWGLTKYEAKMALKLQDTESKLLSKSKKRD